MSVTDCTYTYRNHLFSSPGLWVSQMWLKLRESVAWEGSLTVMLTYALTQHLAGGVAEGGKYLTTSISPLPLSNAQGNMKSHIKYPDEVVVYISGLTLAESGCAQFLLLLGDLSYLAAWRRYSGGQWQNL